MYIGNQYPVPYQPTEQSSVKFSDRPQQPSVKFGSNFDDMFAQMLKFDAKKVIQNLKAIPKLELKIQRLVELLPLGTDNSYIFTPQDFSQAPKDIGWLALKRSRAKGEAGPKLELANKYREKGLEVNLTLTLNPESPHDIQGISYTGAGTPTEVTKRIRDIIAALDLRQLKANTAEEIRPQISREIQPTGFDADAIIKSLQKTESVTHRTIQMLAGTLSPNTNDAVRFTEADLEGYPGAGTLEVRRVGTPRDPQLEIINTYQDGNKPATLMLALNPKPPYQVIDAHYEGPYRSPEAHISRLSGVMAALIKSQNAEVSSVVGEHTGLIQRPGSDYHDPLARFFYQFPLGDDEDVTGYFGRLSAMPAAVRKSLWPSIEELFIPPGEKRLPAQFPKDPVIVAWTDEQQNHSILLFKPQDRGLTYLTPLSQVSRPEDLGRQKMVLEEADAILAQQLEFRASVAGDAKHFINVLSDIDKPFESPREVVHNIQLKDASARPYKAVIGPLKELGKNLGISQAKTLPSFFPTADPKRDYIALTWITDETDGLTKAMKWASQLFKTPKAEAPERYTILIDADSGSVHVPASYRGTASEQAAAAVKIKQVLEAAQAIATEVNPLVEQAVVDFASLVDYPAELSDYLVKAKGISEEIEKRSNHIFAEKKEQHRAAVGEYIKWHQKVSGESKIHRKSAALKVLEKFNQAYEENKARLFDFYRMMDNTGSATYGKVLGIKQNRLNLPELLKEMKRRADIRTGRLTEPKVLGEKGYRVEIEEAEAVLKATAETIKRDIAEVSKRYKRIEASAGDNRNPQERAAAIKDNAAAIQKLTVDVEHNIKTARLAYADIQALEQLFNEKYRALKNSVNFEVIETDPRYAPNAVGEEDDTPLSGGESASALDEQAIHDLVTTQNLANFDAKRIAQLQQWARDIQAAREAELNKNKNSKGPRK